MMRRLLIATLAGVFLPASAMAANIPTFGFVEPNQMTPTINSLVNAINNSVGTAASPSFAGIVLNQGYTVATLPTCNAAAKGTVVYVNDATTPTYNGALTGGGAVIVPVFCNGTAWSSH